MDRPDELAAHLDRPPAVRRRNLLHAAADPVPGLEHDDVRAAGREVTRGREAGEAGTENDDVAQLAAASSSASTRSASGGRYAVTSWPTSYSSTSSSFATSAWSRSPPGRVTNTCVVEPR